MLRQLAKAYGIQTAYSDAAGQRRVISAETLLATLQALDPLIRNSSDLSKAYQQFQINWWRQGLEPIILAWQGKFNQLALRIPQLQAQQHIQCQLTTQEGKIHCWQMNLKKASTLNKESVAGSKYILKQWNPHQQLPLGYHRLTIETAHQCFNTTLIAAPKHAYSPLKSPNSRVWGVFIPLYALHSANSFGSGDLSDLSELIDWVASQKGRLVGTLPLFANFFAHPYEPSPYSPASRLFFSEFYLDVTQIEEFHQSLPAQRFLASADVQLQLDTLRRSPLVDYKETLALKRTILEILTKNFFTHASADRKNAFQQFLIKTPRVEDYAAFRAVQEKNGQPWIKWPIKQRNGQISSEDYDPQVKNYYLYTQWQIQEQLQKVAEHAKNHQAFLYLDMPLGVHPFSYDVWRERSLFATNLAVGAAPDPGFPQGQNWNFPPLIPHQLRQSGYQYFIENLRQVLPYVGLLRLDHVMGLHRLYCIPQGFTPHQGAYIRYAAEELYAILCLESHQYKTGIVGENLGTVPNYVNKAMIKHHLQRMYVLQYELDSKHPIMQRSIPLHSITSLNTHDMPTFATYIQKKDPIEKKLPPLPQVNKSRSRLQQLLQGCLNLLSISRSQFLLINLEDLWYETQPQNIPSSQQNSNWRHKARHSLEKCRQNSTLCAILKNITKLRSNSQGLGNED